MENVRISPIAYLRTMFNIAWSAFRYPTTTTVIDLGTGKIVENINLKNNPASKSDLKSK